MAMKSIVLLAAAVAAVLAVASGMLPLTREAVRARYAEMYGIPREYKVRTVDVTRTREIAAMNGRGSTAS